MQLCIEKEITETRNNIYKYVLIFLIKKLKKKAQLWLQYSWLVWLYCTPLVLCIEVGRR